MMSDTLLANEISLSGGSFLRAEGNVGYCLHGESHPSQPKAPGKGSQAQYIFKAFSFISTWLSKGFRGGRRMWHVFGQVSQALQ